MIFNRIKIHHYLNKKKHVSKKTNDFYVRQYEMLQEHISNHLFNSDELFLTVIIRTQGKRLDTLKDALDSLVKQTNQKFKVILICHKVSNEKEKEIKNLCDLLPINFKARLNIVSLDEGNRTTPLNKGLEICDTEYASFLDDDDLTYPCYVDNFYQLYQKEYGKLFHQYVLAQNWEYSLNNSSPNGPFIYKYCNNFNFIAQRKLNYCPLMGIAFPVYLFKTLNLKFDETLNTAEDWNYITRCSYLSGVVDIPIVGALYRLWTNSTNSYIEHSNKIWVKDYIKSLKSFNKLPVIYSFTDNLSHHLVKLNISENNYLLERFANKLENQLYEASFFFSEPILTKSFNLVVPLDESLSVKLENVEVINDSDKKIDLKSLLFDSDEKGFKNTLEVSYKNSLDVSFFLPKLMNVKMIKVTYTLIPLKHHSFKKDFYNIKEKFKKHHNNKKVNSQEFSEEEKIILKYNQNCKKEDVVHGLLLKRQMEKHIHEVYSQPLNKPFLSIITRTQGKRSEMLEELLLDLSSQSCHNFELLIIPHKVSEDKIAIINEQVNNLPTWLKKQTRILPIYYGNRTAPLNYGASQSNGLYFVVLDDDDIVFEDYVKNFYELFLNNYGKVLHQYAVCQEWKILENNYGKILYPTGSIQTTFATDFDVNEQKSLNHCPISSICFPTYCFQEMNMKYDESLTTTEDWEYINRVAFLLGVADTNKIGSNYRLWINGDNSHITESKKDWDNNYYRIRKNNQTLPVLDIANLLSKNYVNPYVVELFLANNKKIKSENLVGALYINKDSNGGIMANFNDLSKNGPIKYVRLDPDFIARRVEKFKMELFDENDHLIDKNEYTIKTNGKKIDDITYLFKIDDPQIIITLKNKMTLKRAVFSYSLLGVKVSKMDKLCVYLKSPKKLVKRILRIFKKS